MQQIMIHIAGAGILKLPCENTLDLFLRLNRKDRGLYGNREFLTRIAVNDRALQSGSVVIRKARIKTGESVPNKLICHLIQLIKINVCGFSADYRQTHISKPTVS